MLNDLRITINSMRELSDQRRGQVIISSIMSVANGKLPGLLSAYRNDHPGIELHVWDGVHGTVIEDVRSGTADFGITYADDLLIWLTGEVEYVYGEGFEQALLNGGINYGAALLALDRWEEVNR